MKEHSETRRDYHFEDVEIFFLLLVVLTERCVSLWEFGDKVKHF